MSKVMRLDNAENQQLRELLQSLMLTRASAANAKEPVNRAIRQHCKRIIAGSYPKMIKDMALHISRKTLCDHTLLVAVSSFNELVRGELEMLRDGELVTIDPGSQTEIQ